MPHPQQHRIQAASSAYTTAHGDLIHWARSGIEPATSWMLVRFVNRWAMMGTPSYTFYCMIAAPFIQSLLCARGTKPNLIFAVITAGRDFYCHAVLQVEKDSLPHSRFLRAVIAVLFIYLVFFFLRAAPMPYGSSQARGQTGTAAAGLHHCQSRVGSELHLWWPAPQLTATQDP